MGNECPKPPCEAVPSLPVSITVSDDVIEKLKSKQLNFSAPEARQIALENMANYYVGKMKCVQDMHTESRGLSSETFERLYNGIRKRLEVHSDFGEEEEEKLIEKIKESKSILESSDELQEFEETLRNKYQTMAARFAEHPPIIYRKGQKTPKVC